MKDLIATFTKQLTEGIAIGEKANFTAPANEIRNVIITGLGGSGIGGSIVAQVTEKEIKIPILVNKDYFLPNYVDQHTLVIVSSYSGNTEETVQCFEMALEKKAKICCVTAGGKILEWRKRIILIISSFPEEGLRVQLSHTRLHNCFMFFTGIN